ncbi:MAG: preprotein translocase subunit SecE [Firmicutes bacterium]|nr:preprotein translocase subunit SecE [Bacillota bacterium]
MAKNGKPTSKDFDAQREAEAKAAKQKLKAAEKAPKAGKDAGKAKAEKAPKSRKARRFWKDFRGEIKKIVWPDFKTIMKNTGIVLLTVVIIGSMVWILDYVLSGSVRGLKTLAQGARVEQTIPFSEEDYPETTLPEETAAGTQAGDETQAETEAETQAETEPATEPVTQPTTQAAE